MSVDDFVVYTYMYNGMYIVTCLNVLYCYPIVCRHCICDIRLPMGVQMATHLINHPRLQQSSPNDPIQRSCL